MQPFTDDEVSVDIKTKLNKKIGELCTLDYQSLFEKGARAPPRKDDWTGGFALWISTHSQVEWAAEFSFGKDQRLVSQEEEIEHINCVSLLLLNVSCLSFV